MGNYNTCPMCKSKLDINNSINLDILCDICGYYKIQLPLFIRLHEDYILKDKLFLIASDCIFNSSKYEQKPFIITQEYLNNLETEIRSKTKLYRLTFNIFKNMKNIGDTIDSRRIHRYWGYSNNEDEFGNQLETLSKLGIIELKEAITANAGRMIISVKLNPEIYITLENENIDEEEFYNRYIRGENIIMPNINVNGDGNIIGNGNRNNSINIEKNIVTNEYIKEKLKSLGVDSKSIESINSEINELASELNNKAPDKGSLRTIFNKIKEKLGTMALPVFNIALSNHKEIAEIIANIGNSI